MPCTHWFFFQFITAENIKEGGFEKSQNLLPGGTQLYLDSYLRLRATSSTYRIVENDLMKLPNSEKKFGIIGEHVANLVGRVDFIPSISGITWYSTKAFCRVHGDTNLQAIPKQIMIVMMRSQQV